MAYTQEQLAAFYGMSVAQYQAAKSSGKLAADGRAKAAAARAALAGDGKEAQRILRSIK